MPLAEIAGQAINAGMGIALGAYNDKRQLKQQGKLQDQQIKGQKEMTDYNYNTQLNMWNATNYEAQMKHLENAGLNPGLIYGMGGSGGATAGNASGNVSGAQAPSGGNEAMAMMQMGLMNAQRENIKADTENKKVQTLKTGEEKTKLELENVINDLWVNRDTEGNMITDETKDKDRGAFKERVEGVKKTEAEKQFKIDENTRQQLINNPEIQKIQQQIQLMKQQGMQAEEMTKNLEKEGQIKQMEIEWSKMGLTRESLTKFLQILIMKAL